MDECNTVRTGIFLLLYGVFITGVVCNICATDNLDAKMMQENLFVGSLPKSGRDAGQYLLDKNAKDAAHCIISCCQIPQCNIALFTKKQCFTIQCNTGDPEACKPKLQTDPAFNDTYMIQVRSLEEVSSSCDPNAQTGCDEHQTCQVSVGANSAVTTTCVCNHGYKWKSPLSKICEPDSDSTDSLSSNTHAPSDPSPCMVGQEGQCNPQQECRVIGESSTVGICWCKEGFDWDKDGHCIYIIQTCEFGLGDCKNNEECRLAEGSKSKVGVCECRAGFTRDQEGHCLSAIPVADKTTTVSSTVVDKTEAVFPVAANITEKPQTTETSTTTTPKVQMLTVSAGENRDVQLPDNKISLKAFVLPSEDAADPYHYVWSLEKHPEGAESGQMDGKNTDTLKLSALIAGLYTFRVQVTGTNRFGEASVNVTVLPPARVNKPPVAIIKPSSVQIKIQNTVMLDGSDSTDDDQIVSYHWEEVSGPLQDQTITDDSAILTLKNLAPGNYIFKLTVTDSDGATNSSTANVTAIKETDYPPKANAGSDVVIHLPINSVVLNGNLSTDDKGIVKYEWIKSDEGNLAADMQGARSSELHVSNLEVGDYTFTLKVTDAADQSSIAEVHVFVKPEENQPPVAQTQQTMSVVLPLDSILLDGTNSTDDTTITSYLWQQKGGPTTLTIENSDRVVASASGKIHTGEYKFKLTVTDAAGLQSSDTLVVTVKESINEPPVANAGGDLTIQLPQLYVALDGSRSHDDHGISSFHWERDSKSLAAGEVLNQSDHQAVLQLVNLVAGHYSFTLTVMDAQGLSSQDKASVTVKEDLNKLDLLELLIDADIRKFSVENKKNLEGQLALLLPKTPLEGDTVIETKKLEEDPASGHIRVNFYAMDVLKDSRKIRHGVDVLKILKKKLMSTSNILDYRVVAIDTYICQNNCSGHGHCDLRTKLCVCEAFWTQNFFLYLIEQESNCDWSILYVVIVCFILVLVLTGSAWGCICCWKRRRCRCRLRSKKRHRYSLLQNMDDDKDSIEMTRGKGKMQNSSVMISESDFSSEEETLFINHKKSNGFIPKHLNGVSKQHLQNKTKA